MSLATSNLPSLPEGANLLSRLGERFATLRLEDAPAEAVKQAKLCVLDTIGCYLAGAATPEAMRLLRCEQDMADGGGARVFGHDAALPIDAAMRVNGYMGDIFELNDLIGGHASIAAVTVATTLGEVRKKSGRDVLRATLVGVETIGRVYSGYYSDLKAFTETGITPPGIPSTIGSAAAAASLLDLSAEDTSHALANAGALAGWCPAEVIFGDGRSVKPMLFGAWPSSVGFLGATYAAHGVTGPLRLLESDIGFFKTVAHKSNLAAALNDEYWHLEHPRRKLHACCGYIHSALDVVIALRNRLGGDLSDYEIDIAMPAYVIPAVSKTRPPTTAHEARFHTQYCIALAATGVDVITPEHSIDFRRNLERPEIQTLMAAVRVDTGADLSHYHHCRVTLRPKSGGAPIVSEGRGPKGSPQNPMSDEEVVAKFLRLAEPLLGGAGASGYAERILDLENQSDIGWMFASQK